MHVEKIFLPAGDVKPLQAYLHHSTKGFFGMYYTEGVFHLLGLWDWYPVGK